jgi:uncharacterized protein (TIGR02453 family)
MSGFAGMPTEALDFYEGLEADNSKSYWLDHKDGYDTAVRAPMTALAHEAAERLGVDAEVKVFRPYKDARRTHGGSLYKTHQGAFVQVLQGVGYYVQVSAAGLLVSGGWHPHGEQLHRYRESVDSPAGAELDRLLTDLTAHGWRVDGGRELTRAPAGMSPDHPRIHLLRYRQLTAGRDLGWPDWIGTPAATRELADRWRALAPLLQWLVDRVGPGDDEPQR